MARRAHRQGDRWDAHPILAMWVRLAVVLIPLFVSIVVALVAIAVLPRGHVLWTETLWWVLVLGSAYFAAYAVDRAARRALPLAALLQLSLVFPDRAPSRLKTARKTGLREIERQVADLHAAGEHGHPDEAARTLVSLVGALGLHDKRTRGHSERVRAYVDLLSEEMGLHEEDRIRLRWSALLHDIGKLSVPGTVLNGGSDLSEDEWEALHRHPIEGERLASALMPWLGEWGLCVREHHERWDGSGYPHGLKGNEISLGARIVAVADAYEVMTANRSYQKAISPAAARQELSRCAGADFDPAVVRAFLQISIGRLRGVLGPLSLLPAVPFAAVADRAGEIVKGFTTVAAVSAVAVGFAPATVHPKPHPPVALGGVGAGDPTLPPVTADTPLPTPTPTPTPSAAPTPAATPTPTPTKSASAPPAPVVVVPTSQAAVSALGPVLYLGNGGGLSNAAPAPGSSAVPPSSTYVTDVPTSMTLSGAPTVVLFHQLRPTHGKGQPAASMTVTLSVCSAGACHTLSTGSVTLNRGRGFVSQSVRLGKVHASLAAGEQLRLTVSVTTRSNVSAIVIGYGGKTPSRLTLP